METYLLTIMVTFEQEYAIQKLFGRHGWEYSKINSHDEMPLDLKLGERSPPAIQPVENQQPFVKQTITSDSLNIVTSEDDKDSNRAEATPAVKVLVENGADNVLDNSINSEAGSYHNEEDDDGDGDDDYGGDTDTEQTLESLGIVVKVELESDDGNGVDEASKCNVNSIKKRSSNVKSSGKGKRPAPNKVETRKNKKRKQTTSTITSTEIKDNVDKAEREVKLEKLSSKDHETDDPLAVLETLPDIEHVSKVVSSNTHDVETFMTGPGDIDDSGYSVSLSVYFCKDCHYTFPEEKYYTLHKRSGKCVFQCQFCDKKYTFKTFSKYQEHLKEHRFITSMDDIVVEQSDGLALDKSLVDALVEEAEDFFSCDICKKSYKSKSALKRHLKVHTDKIQCKACTQFFETKEKLMLHRGNKHPSHLCVFCGKCFSSKSNLDRHTEVHADTRNEDKVLKCPVENCNKRFILKASYEAHVNSHPGSKQYQCSQCGHTYSNKYRRNHHEKICKGHVKITCTICQTNFRRKDLLQKHTLAKHTDKRFYCACGKNYSFLSALQRHAKKCMLS